MNFTAAFRLATNILTHAKLRSWLTIVGIVIGVAAVILIIGIGQGAQASLQSRLGGLGTNQITISPGMERAAGPGGAFRDHVMGNDNNAATTRTSKAQKNLTSRDVNVLSALPNIKLAMGLFTGRQTATFQGQNATVQIRGIDAIKWKTITTSTILQGNYLQPKDYVGVIVGNRIATNVFKNPPLAINSKIVINDIELKVIGILNPSVGFGSGDDNAVIMLEKTARQVMDNKKDDYNSITIIPYDGLDTGIIVNDTTLKLQLFRGETDKTQTFSVTSAAATAQTIQDTLSNLTLFLTAIAVISLIVGAIGIANTMFTAVLEKTKDIGIMKAVGVTDADVLLVFLINASLVGLTGGIIGVTLGLIAVDTLGRISINIPGSGGGIQAIVPLSLILEMLAFSVIIGAIAGLIPAYNASKLKPAVALKYE